jgi:hypothetical protein
MKIVIINLTLDKSSRTIPGIELISEFIQTKSASYRFKIYTL